MKRFVPKRNLTYQQDGLYTVHNCDFIRDPRFQKAYLLGKATGSWSDLDVEWRAYICCWAAEKGLSVGGDFVECGVNRGGLSRAVMEYVGFKNLKDRKFYLLDTYRGLPEKYRESSAAPDYVECYEDVVKTFQEFENAVIIRGEVPGTLAQVESKRVCYLSIDMNCPEPEVAAMDFFWDKLSSGAVAVLDDYGYANAYLPQKRALDEFAARKGVPILTLPTGQGLLIKP